MWRQIPLDALLCRGERGIVIVSCDDPELYSSQNEQDNRNYAKFAKVPMLEPSDSQEAKDFVKLGFEISEKFDTPVMVRGVTRLSHAKGIVELNDPVTPPISTEIRKQFDKLPCYPRLHGFVTKSLKSAFSN